MKNNQIFTRQNNQIFTGQNNQIFTRQNENKYALAEELIKDFICKESRITHWVMFIDLDEATFRAVRLSKTNRS
jgi:hypothetical protein